VIVCEGFGIVNDSWNDFLVHWFPTLRGLLVEVIHRFTRGQSSDTINGGEQLDCLRAHQELRWSWTLDAACVASLSVLNSHVWQTKCTREQATNADKKDGPNHGTGDLIHITVSTSKLSLLKVVGKGYSDVEWLSFGITFCFSKNLEHIFMKQHNVPPFSQPFTRSTHLFLQRGPQTTMFCGVAPLHHAPTDQCVFLGGERSVLESSLVFQQVLGGAHLGQDLEGVSDTLPGHVLLSHFHERLHLKKYDRKSQE